MTKEQPVIKQVLVRNSWNIITTILAFIIGSVIFFSNVNRSYGQINTNTRGIIGNHESNQNIKECMAKKSDIETLSNKIDKMLFYLADKK